MKKLLLVLIPSMLLVACGDGKETENTEIVETTTTSTMVETTTTTVAEDPVIQETPSEEDVTPPTPTTNKPAVKPASQGGVIGQISIPSIGVNWPIREGIELSVLNKSPGHYPHSPKPCRAGNAAIAGHRTTYGAPFNKLDVLKAGDVVNITTPEGDCTYRYLRTEIVSPNNVAVVLPKDGNANLLTLTACHPKGSAKQRIVATFTLEHVVVK